MSKTDKDPRAEAFAAAMDIKDIDLVPGKTSGLINQVLNKISNKPATEIFQSSGMLVRIVHAKEAPQSKKIEREKISYLVMPHTRESLLDSLSSYGISFRKFDFRKQDYKPCDPPSNFLSAVLERKRYPNIPVLRGVIEAPVLRSDGSVQKEPGYDSATGLFLVNDGTDWAALIPEKATHDDARASLENLRSAFCSLPFESDADESVFICGVLVPYVRHLLPSSPANVMTASMSGAGKTLGCQLPGILFQGHRPAVISLGKDDEEARKQLFSVLLLKDRMVVFDNIDRTLSGDFFCSLLTSNKLRGRLLGTNFMTDVATDVVIFFNGNNVVVKGDLANRVLFCRLKVDRERPDEREFDFDLRERILTNRKELIKACLTVLMAWYQSGRKHQGLYQVGRFEEWSRSIRECLVWLGLEDPCAKRAETLLQDPEAAGLEAVLTTWYAVYQDAFITTQKILKDLSREYLSEEEQNLKDALLEVAGDQDAINRNRLGKYLSRYQDRIVNGFFIQQGAISGGVRKWRVKLLIETNEGV